MQNIIYYPELEPRTFRLTSEADKLLFLSIVTSSCIRGSDFGRYPSWTFITHVQNSGVDMNGNQSKI